jgi:hypothetical protein
LGDWAVLPQRLRATWQKNTGSASENYMKQDEKSRNLLILQGAVLFRMNFDGVFNQSG